MQLRICVLLYVSPQDVHSRKLRGSFIQSAPTIVQTQEEHSSISTNGADEFAYTATGKDLAAVILKKDEKKGMQYWIPFICIIFTTITF